MTRGHFHAKRGRGEFYTTLCGYGALILMGENQQTYSQQMRRGTVHYIAGGIAHRVANTGTERLIFCACWPSDAGHDYESISATGFSSRLCNRGEAPTLLRTD
jgi:glucose-6-phosphate isomerase